MNWNLSFTPFRNDIARLEQVAKLIVKKQINLQAKIKYSFCCRSLTYSAFLQVVFKKFVSS